MNCDKLKNSKNNKKANNREKGKENERKEEKMCGLKVK